MSGHGIGTSRARRAAVLLSVLALGCGSGVDPGPPRGAAFCDEGERDTRTWGLEALDRLVALPVDASAPARMFVEDASGPARVLFATDASTLVSPAVAPRLSDALSEASAAPLDEVPLDARLSLQNDVWGLWQRLDEAPPGPVRDGLRARAAALIVHLAPAASALGDGSALPSLARRALPEREGWRERGTEHSVLSHELAFGLRRIFRVLTREAELDRAIVGQLVALDDEGTAHLVPLAGGLEVLQLSEGRPRTRVLELSRHSLRCGPPRLEPMDLVHGVPGLGVNRPLAALEPPAPPTPSVCAQCHEDVEGRPDLLMSLPTDDVTRLPRRWGDLLARASVEGRAIVSSR